MFVYVLTDDKWMETESLFPHDVALLIDNKQKKVYFWAGPKADETQCDRGTQMASEMMQKYKLYELIVLDDNVVPLKIQSEIDILLGENADPEKNKLARTLGMQVYMVFGIIGLTTLAIFVINNLRIFGWSEINRYEVSSSDFSALFDVSRMILLVALTAFIIQGIIAIFSNRTFLIACTIASIGITIGAIMYIDQREFIFEFLRDAPTSIYWIVRGDVHAHVIWTFVILATAGAPAVISYQIIKKQTEIVPKKEIDIDEMRMKAKPTILRDRETSVTMIEKKI